MVGLRCQECKAGHSTNQLETTPTNNDTNINIDINSDIDSPYVNINVNVTMTMMMAMAMAMTRIRDKAGVVAITSISWYHASVWPSADITISPHIYLTTNT